MTNTQFHSTRNAPLAVITSLLALSLVAGCVSVDAATSNSNDEFLQKVTDKSQEASKRENEARLAELELLKATLHCYAGRHERTGSVAARFESMTKDEVSTSRVQNDSLTRDYGTDSGGSC